MHLWIHFTVQLKRAASLCCIVGKQKEINQDIRSRNVDLRLLVHHRYHLQLQISTS